MIEHGERAESVQRQVEQQDLPFDRWPKFLQERPCLLPGLDLFLEAFNDLATCRAIGLSVGPIPFTAVLEYARFHDFDHETTEILVAHLRAMDTAFLRYHQGKAKPSSS